MQKVLLCFMFSLLIISCVNYTVEQKKAATAICECMEKDENGISDADMLYYICFEEHVKDSFQESVIKGEGYANALFKICPEQNLVQEIDASQ